VLQGVTSDYQVKYLRSERQGCPTRSDVVAWYANAEICGHGKVRGQNVGSGKERAAFAGAMKATNI
jgi:hypothetical protein